MWRDWNLHTLLEEMQNASILENSLEVPLPAHGKPEPGPEHQWNALWLGFWNKW